MRSLKQIGLYLVAFFIVSLLFEGLLRQFWPQEIVPKYTQINFGIPNSLKKNYQASISHLGFRFHLKTYDNGLRTIKSFKYKKPLNTFRILLLGNSVFFGLGVDIQNRLDSYLLKILKPHFNGKKIEIINAATPGWGLIEYYLYLSNEGYKYSPDLIILSQFGQDLKHFPLQYLEFKDIRIETKSGALILLSNMTIQLQNKSALGSIAESIGQSILFDKLTRLSQVLSLMRKKSSILSLRKKLSKKQLWPKLKALWRAEGFSENQTVTWEFKDNHSIARFSDSSLNEAAEVAYLFLIRSIIRLAETLSSKILFVNLPSQQDVLAIKQPNHKLKRLLEEEDIDIFDPLSELIHFQNETRIPLYLLDDNHWSPAGHYLMAHLISDYLQRGILKISNTALNPLALKVVHEIRNSNNKILHIITNSPYHKFFLGMLDKNTNQMESAKINFKNFIKITNFPYEAFFQLGEIYALETNTSLAHDFYLRATETPKTDKKRYLEGIRKLYLKSDVQNTL